MNNDLNNISAKRYMLIRNILDSSENKKFYNEMDALLLKKYFDNAYETSLLEDMYRINSSDISNKIIFNFLDNFELSVNTVSYTHLDVYKRQEHGCCLSKEELIRKYKEIF